MGKSDKELAVELTCAMLQEFSQIAIKHNVQALPHSKEQIAEMVTFFATELSKIKNT